MGNVTYSAISPTDGSLWMTTPGQGLVRVGRNGKAFAYNAAKGDFTCDSIEALAFDSDGTLWMRDAEGSFWSYTSFSGFVRQESAPETLQNQLSLKAETESVVAAAPETPRTPRSYHWYGGWWMLVVTGLLLLALFLKNSKRKEAKPSIFETKTPFWKPSAPSQQSAPTAPQAASVVQKPAPAQPVEPVAAKPSAQNAATTASGSAALASKPAVAAPKPATTAAKPVGGAFYAKVKDIIEKNYTNADFGVETVAEMLGMSRVHLNRKLKEESAPSPSSLIKKMRMDLAAKLLREGNANIADVAARSGFSSATYFSSAFKEYYNISPTQYSGS